MYFYVDLDNNHIKVIEGLTNNIKLNVLSLGKYILIQPITKYKK